MTRFVIAHWACAVVALNPPSHKNRPFGGWLHFSTTTRIVYRFHSCIFKFGNPNEFSAKVLICTRKQNPEGFWSYSKMTSSCKWPPQEPIWTPAYQFKIYLRELLFQLVPLRAIDKNISAPLWHEKFLTNGQLQKVSLCKFISKINLSTWNFFQVY